MRKLLFSFSACGLIALSGCATQEGSHHYWDTDALAHSQPQHLALNYSQDNKSITVTTMERSRAERLVEIRGKISSAAITPVHKFYISDDKSPNAFAGVDRKTGDAVIVITIPMLSLLGDDNDAYAALLGHETAHITLKHQEAHETRRNILQGIGAIVTAVVAVKTGANVGGLSNTGIDLVDNVYNRDQERDADAEGVRYMVAAGYDPQGAVRLQRKLLAAAKSTPLPFLSSHPSSEERVANIEKIVAALPSRPAGQNAVENNSLKPVVYANGDTYVGEFKGGKFNGQGTYTFSYGDKYVGEFKNGTFSGQGTRTFVNGNKFVGEFSGGEFNGQGTFAYINGDKYVGEFKDGKRNGQGVYTLINGNKYIGEFKDDNISGAGTEYLSDGSIGRSGRWERGNFVGDR